MRDDHKIFLERLTVKKNELEDTLSRLMYDQKEYRDQLASEKIADEFDNAQREMSATAIYSLIDKKTQEVKKIELLIRQIFRDEDFGICEECGDPIPTDRLLIVPEANMCVPCQREEEKFNRSRNLGTHVSTGYNSTKINEWQDSVGKDSTQEGDFDSG